MTLADGFVLPMDEAKDLARALGIKVIGFS
jgi:hypothetical protein